MVSLLLNGPIRELLITAKVCMLLVHSWDYCTMLAVDIVHRHYRLVRFGCPTPLEACLVPSGTLRASPQGKKFKSVPTQRPLGPGLKCISQDNQGQ